MSAERFNAGSAKPFSAVDAFQSLKSLMYDMAQRMNLFGHTIQRVSNAASTLEHSIGRLSAGLMLLVGAPRAFRGGAHATLVNVARSGGGHGGAVGRLAAAGGHSGGSDFPGWKAVYEERWAAEQDFYAKRAQREQEQQAKRLVNEAEYNSRRWAAEEDFQAKKQALRKQKYEEFDAWYANYKEKSQASGAAAAAGTTNPSGGSGGGYGGLVEQRAKVGREIAGHQAAASSGDLASRIIAKKKLENAQARAAELDAKILAHPDHKVPQAGGTLGSWMSGRTAPIPPWAPPGMTAGMSSASGPILHPVAAGMAKSLPLSGIPVGMAAGMSSASAPVAHPVARQMAMTMGQPASPGVREQLLRSFFGLTHRDQKKAGEDGRESYLERRRQYGLFGKPQGGQSIAEEKWEKFNKGLEKATYAFLGMSAAAQGFLRAASPDLFATFTGSLQMLAGEVGLTLIPTFVGLSKFVQDASFSFAGMSKEAKSTVGTLFTWGLGIAAALTGVKLLISLLSPFASGIKFAIDGVKALGLKGTATAGVLATLAAAYGAALVASTGDKKDQRNRETLAEDAKKRQADMKEVMSDPFLSKFAPQSGMTEQEREALKGRIKAAMPEADRAADQIGGIRDQMEAEYKKPMFGPSTAFGLRWPGLDNIYRKLPHNGTFDFSKGFLGDTASKFLPGKSHKEMMEDVNEQANTAERRRKGLKDLLGSVETGKELPDVTNARAGTSRSLLMNLQSFRVQPKYQAVEEAYKNVQLEALGKNELEQKLDDIYKQGILKMVEADAQALGKWDEVLAYLRSIGAK